jgi:hypothetical protein
MDIPILTPGAQETFEGAVSQHALTNTEQIAILHRAFGLAIASGEDMVYTSYVYQAITEVVKARPVQRKERVRRIVSVLAQSFHQRLEFFQQDNEGLFDAEGDLQLIEDNVWDEGGTIAVKIGGIPLVITITEAPAF